MRCWSVFLVSPAAAFAAAPECASLGSAFLAAWRRLAKRPPGPAAAFLPLAAKTPPGPPWIPAASGRWPWAGVCA